MGCRERQASMLPRKTPRFPRPKATVPVAAARSGTQHRPKAQTRTSPGVAEPLLDAEFLPADAVDVETHKAEHDCLYDAIRAGLLEQGVSQDGNSLLGLAARTQKAGKPGWGGIEEMAVLANTFATNIASYLKAGRPSGIPRLLRWTAPRPGAPITWMVELSFALSAQSLHSPNLRYSAGTPLAGLLVRIAYVAGRALITLTLGTVRG